MLTAMMQMYKDMVQAGEAQDETFGRVRKLISDALVNKDDIDTKELMVITLQAQHALLTAQQVSTQQTTMSLKQMVEGMEGPLKALEDEMKKFGEEGLFGPDGPDGPPSDDN